MAILRCYEFIQHNTFHIVIARIAKMIRGIGDPLVAMYVRCYLSRKGYEVAANMKDYLLESFYDFLFSLRALKETSQSQKFSDELKANFRVSLAEYYHLYSPALDWMLQCIGHNSSQVLLSIVSFELSTLVDSVLIPSPSLSLSDYYI